jgi:hypothetical protein
MKIMREVVDEKKYRYGRQVDQHAFSLSRPNYLGDAVSYLAKLRNGHLKCPHYSVR